MRVMAWGMVLVLVLTTSAAERPENRPKTPVPAQDYVERIKGPSAEVSIEMIRIPGGKFRISVDGKEAEREVEIKAFWISRTELTFEQWDFYMLQKDEDYRERKPLGHGADAVARPSPPYTAPDHNWGREGKPMLDMSYTAAVRYCKWLSLKTGKTFRVPKEAEWMWACTAGGREIAKLDEKKVGEMAWCLENSEVADELRSHPVAKKRPNAWGLHDMLGNVGEWCAKMDAPAGADQFKWGVLRGGHFMKPAKEISWQTREPYTLDWQLKDPQEPKSTWWLSDAPFAGIRVVREE